MLSQFFISRPRFAFVIAILMCIAGLIALAILPMAQYPNITPAQVSVTTAYPGADALTVDQTIVTPLITKINGVKDMLYMSSSASDDGVATITVTFPAGSNGDMNTVNVQNRVAQVATLPTDVKNQGVITKEKSPSFLMLLYLKSHKRSSAFLTNYIYLYIQDEIARVKGVGDVALFGAANYAMRIWLNPESMSAYGLTPADVISAIREQNVQVTAGAVGEEPGSGKSDNRFSVNTRGRFSSAEEFEEIIIRTAENGGELMLKNIARVELGAENYSSVAKIFTHGQTIPEDAGVLAVFQLSDANALKLTQDVDLKLKELSKMFPDDLEYGVLYDSTRFVRASVEEVVVTLFEAVFLVILVTFIFLQDWRATLIPSLAIPCSLISTFAVLFVLGYSINLITLFALILAIGIVVDDAIVVVENVYRLMEEEGLDPVAAARKSMMQVTSPVIATTLVLLAMFIPVCFLPGITGEIYRQFGITISVAVLFSSVNALTLSPALCATLMKAPRKDAKPFILFRWFNLFFEKLTATYSRVVASLVRKTIFVMIFYIILGLLGLDLYMNLPSSFMPEEDQGAFFTEVQLPDAASLPRTERLMERTGSLMAQVDGVKKVLIVPGRSMLSGSCASSVGFMTTELETWSKRDTPALSINSIIMQCFKIGYVQPEGHIFSFPLPAIPGLGTAGGFSFVIEDTYGLDPVRLQDALDEMTKAMGTRPEINAQRTMTTFRANVPRIFLNIDRNKAMQMGVNMQEINTALQSFQGYSYVNDFDLFGKSFKVEVQADSQYRETLKDIRNIFVRNKQGTMLPLATLVQNEIKFGPTQITRYNMYPSVTITGIAAPGYSSGQAMTAMEELAKTHLPSGMKYEWTDLSYQEQLAGNQTVYIYMIALLFIYLFLVAQYESWMIPVSVMLSVPIAFVGSVVFMMYLNIDNNIYAQVGFVLLFGLACKTAILIVEFAKEKREEGLGLYESACFAAKLRFRAVLMTAISFILGVIPLVIAVGAGAGSRRALGTVVFGGMLISCIFGTLLIPSFFVFAQGLIEKISKRKTPKESEISS